MAEAVHLKISAAEGLPLMQLSTFWPTPIMVFKGPGKFTSERKMKRGRFDGNLMDVILIGMKSRKNMITSLKLTKERPFCGTSFLVTQE